MTNTMDVVGYKVNDKIISTDHMACYYYKTDFINTVVKNDSVPDELKGMVVKYKEFKGKGLFNDKLFKGNVYIPLNTNPINGYNADSNQIKESTSYLYEKAQQQYSTNSSDL